MARIKDTSIDAVRQGADFVAVVEERTPLRKAGARLQGRCPFHEERTPSFSVNPVDKLYHCFGCHKGGDMIEFVRETQGLDFVGAIEWLAERFRIPLEYEESSPVEDAKRLRRERSPDAPRAGGSVLRALPLGLAGRLVRPGLPGGPRARRGDQPGVPARPRARRQHVGPQGSRERIHRRGAARGGARPPERWGLFPAAARLPLDRRPRPGGGIPGAPPARGRSAPGEVRQHARNRSSSPRGPSSTGSTRPARRLPAKIAPASSRGTPT